MDPINRLLVKRHYYFSDCDNIEKYYGYMDNTQYTNQFNKKELKLSAVRSLLIDINKNTYSIENRDGL